VASEQDTFPYVASSLLARRLSRPVETVNAGVSGYSPWQEAIVLRKEGVRYQPDTVVLTFVLNDVTEKFELVRFGGNGVGWQLSQTYTSELERLLDKSRIALAVRHVARDLRFGRDVKAGARQAEALTVKNLVEHPDRPDIRAAWESALHDVDDIASVCAERGLPLALVVSPVLFQLEDPLHPSAPQQTLAAYARRKGLPFLDLLPGLAQRMDRDHGKPLDYFIDSNHYTPAGAHVVGEMMADFLLEHGLPGRPAARSAAAP
jgi:lysophospholipase L1-like esterase